MCVKGPLNPIQSISTHSACSGNRPQYVWTRCLFIYIVRHNFGNPGLKIYKIGYPKIGSPKIGLGNPQLDCLILFWLTHGQYKYVTHVCDSFNVDWLLWTGVYWLATKKYIETGQLPCKEGFDTWKNTLYIVPNI